MTPHTLRATVRAAIEAAGPSGLRVSTLLADLPDEVTAPHLAGILHALQAEGQVACEGESRVMLGLPLRVRAVADGPAAVAAFERRHSGRNGAQTRASELTALRLLAEHGPETARALAAYAGLHDSTLRPRMADGIRLGTMLVCPTWTARGGRSLRYSLTELGRAILAHAQALEAAQPEPEPDPLIAFQRRHSGPNGYSACFAELELLLAMVELGEARIHEAQAETGWGIDKTKRCLLLCLRAGTLTRERTRATGRGESRYLYTLTDAGLAILHHYAPITMAAR